MIVDNALYHRGKRVALGSDDDQSLGRARVPCDPGDFQWIGIHDPSPDELELIARTFDLHPLAVEDAGEPARQHAGRVGRRAAVSDEDHSGHSSTLVGPS